MTLAQQLGNIGSEVHRAIVWRGRDQENFKSSLERAYELIDLTLQDARLMGRFKEIVRMRELLSDASQEGGVYNTTLSDIDAYLLQFVAVARGHAKIQTEAGAN